MTKQTRFCHYLLRRGTSATLSALSGTVCPCMTWRDADHSEYSREYHRLYPDADDCDGTGLISTITTSTTIKGMAYSVQSATAAGLISKEVLEKIGELQKDGLLWIGTVNATSGEFVDLSNLVEREDSITHGSTVYNLRHVFSMPWGDEADVGQIAVLKRNA